MQFRPVSVGDVRFGDRQAEGDLGGRGRPGRQPALDVAAVPPLAERRCLAQLAVEGGGRCGEERGGLEGGLLAEPQRAQLPQHTAQLYGHLAGVGEALLRARGGGPRQYPFQGARAEARGASGTRATSSPSTAPTAYRSAATVMAVELCSSGAG